jgi:hypothetical protein
LQRSVNKDLHVHARGRKRTGTDSTLEEEFEQECNGTSAEEEDEEDGREF